MPDRQSRKEDYRKAVDILDKMLSRFPQEDALASYMLKVYRSSDEMQENSYDASRRALQIMRDANTRGDGGYNAACYQVMMEMAMEKKDYVQAKEDAPESIPRIAAGPSICRHEEKTEGSLSLPNILPLPWKGGFLWKKYDF